MRNLTLKLHIGVWLVALTTVALSMIRISVLGYWPLTIIHAGAFVAAVF